MDTNSIKESIETKVYHLTSETNVPLHKHDDKDEIFYCINSTILEYRTSLRRNSRMHPSVVNEVVFQFSYEVGNSNILRAALAACPAACAQPDRTVAKDILFVFKKDFLDNSSGGEIRHEPCNRAAARTDSTFHAIESVMLAYDFFEVHWKFILRE